MDQFEHIVSQLVDLRELLYEDDQKVVTDTIDLLKELRAENERLKAGSTHPVEVRINGASVIASLKDDLARAVRREVLAELGEAVRRILAETPAEGGSK